MKLTDQDLIMTKINNNWTLKGNYNEILLNLRALENSLSNEIKNNKIGYTCQLLFSCYLARTGNKMMILRSNQQNKRICIYKIAIKLFFELLTYFSSLSETQLISRELKKYEISISSKKAKISDKYFDEAIEIHNRRFNNTYTRLKKILYSPETEEDLYNDHYELEKTFNFELIRNFINPNTTYNENLGIANCRFIQ